jgi:hypothetical protein
MSDEYSMITAQSSDDPTQLTELITFTEYNSTNKTSTAPSDTHHAIH